MDEFPFWERLVVHPRRVGDELEPFFFFFDSSSPDFISENKYHGEDQDVDTKLSPPFFLLAVAGGQSGNRVACLCYSGRQRPGLGLNWFDLLLSSTMYIHRPTTMIKRFSRSDGPEDVSKILFLIKFLDNINFQKSLK